jgi:ATP-dependent Clp protease ATP-binding subunit ClpA
MDYGSLTDNNGKRVNFRNAIIIMTSNAGAAEMSKPNIGFGRGEREGEDKEAVNRLFAPEFRNRLDSIIPFDHLNMEVVEMVVEKFISKLEGQLAERNIHIELTSEARIWLAEKGYDRNNGARPLDRLIQEKIKKPLADEVLFGKLAKGGVVSVTIKDDDVDLKCRTHAAARKPVKEIGVTTRKALPSPRSKEPDEGELV